MGFSSRAILLMAALVFAVTASAQPDPGAGGPKPEPSPSAQKLTGGDAINALIGNTVVAYSRRGFDALYFAPDGAIKGASSDPKTGPSEKGKWLIRGDQLCFAGYEETGNPPEECWWDRLGLDGSPLVLAS
jgi:hypothetical protein